MVRFTAKTSGSSIPRGSGLNLPGTTSKSKSKPSKHRGEYDAAPATRYDPTTMSRIGIDIHSDNEIDLDEMIDPTHSLPYTDNESFAPLGDDLDGLYQMQRRRPRYRPSAACRRCLTMTALFAVVMGVVIGISYLLVDKKAVWLSSAKTPHGTTLPAPPSNLSTVCSAESVGQPGGYQKCEGICVDAECCFLPEGHWFSCKADFGPRCAEYEGACLVLDGFGASSSASSSGSSGAGSGGGKGVLVEVPHAKANLDEMCGPASTATQEGYDKCSTECELARCCSQPIEVCKVTNPDVCAEYKACSVLLDGDAAGTVTSKISSASHPDAVQIQANQKCNTASLMDAAGVQACKDFCDPALCCFAVEGKDLAVTIGGNSMDIVGCANADNQGWCDQYGPCQALLGLQDNDVFDDDDAAEMAVGAACADLETQPGREECGRMCGPAECCFVGNDHCDKMGAGDIDCSHYCPCYEYYDQKSGETAQQVLVPRPPKELENICSGTKFETTAEGRQMCADACSVAKCCVTDIEVCKVTNPQMCGAYEIHCAEVFDQKYEEVTIPEPPKDLEDKCDGVTLQDDKWAQCDDACRPARCCDEDINVCKVLNPHLCEAYEVHCAIVWGDSFHEVTIPPAPRDIDMKCSGISIDEAHRNTCDEACRPAACCDEDIEACKVLNPNECDVYETFCSEVWGDAYQEVTIPTAPADITAVCALGNPDFNANDCEDLCYMAKCCDEDIEACKVLNPKSCDAYEAPCANYWGDSVEIPHPPVNLADTCSIDKVQTNDGYKNCEIMCKDASCCNSPMYACRVRNPDVCSEWSFCDALNEAFDPDSMSGTGNRMEVPPAPANLGLICDANSLSNIRGFNDCEDKCNRARCCLEDVEECVVTNPEVCEAYSSPCTYLYDFKYGGKTVEKTTGSVDGKPTTDSVSLMDLAIQVSEACDTNSLLEVQGRQHCQHLCNDRLCCFETDTKYNCVKDKKDECVAFAACEELLNAAPLGPPPMPSRPAPAPEPPASKPTAPRTQPGSSTANKFDADRENYLEGICSADAISTVEGMATCHDACSNVLCCWSQDPGKNCYDDLWQSCDSSAPCSVLALPDNGDPLLHRHEVADACSPETIDSEGPHSCHEKCAHRLCCFVEAGRTSSCVENRECRDYQACHILVDKNPGDVEVIEAVDDVCADDVIKSEGRDACNKACAQRDCCFKGGPESCLKEDYDWCQEFFICRGSYFPDRNQPAPTKPAPKATPKPTPKPKPAPTKATAPIKDDSDLRDSDMKDEIDSICTESKLSSSAGLKICHEVCDPRFCCFDKKGGANCYDENPHICDQYVGCIKMYDYEGIDYAVFGKLPPTESDNSSFSCKGKNDLPDNEATDVCCSYANDGDADEKSECERLCRHTECCFKQNTRNCPAVMSESMVEFCADFPACEVLYS